MNSLLTPHNLQRPVREFALPAETALQVDWTMQQALRDLQTRRVDQKIIYFYVVDETNRLLGVVPTRKMLLATPETKVRDVMDSPVSSLPANTTLEQALRRFQQDRLLALPVVDEDGKLLGVIDIQLYTDEVIDLAEARRASDLFQIIGFSAELIRRDSAVGGFSRRMPWLLCNLFGGIVCALIVVAFQSILAKMLLVASFVPLVLTLSESISMQSVTLTLQYLHGRRMPWRGLRLRSVREAKIVALLGVTSGLLVAFTAGFWGSNGLGAATLAAGVMISMIMAAGMGIFTPVMLHVLKLDPKVAAGPVVLMFSDILTTGIYLGLCTWWLL